ncbi:MAG: hypothetical protein V4496_07615 [Pseudomonadota bacterium]
MQYNALNQEMDVAKLDVFLENFFEPKEDPIISGLASAEKALLLPTMQDKNQPILSRGSQYWNCMTFFILASAALWAGESAFGSFTFDSSEGGIEAFKSPKNIAIGFAAVFAFGDWINNICTVSPTNDSDDLGLSGSNAQPKTWVAWLLSLVLNPLTYVIKNPLTYLSIDVPFFICYFTGAAAGFNSCLPYLLKLCGNPEFGTPEYYAVVLLDAIATIATGIIYYYCFNSTPVANTQAAIQTFRKKTWSELDLNIFRILESLFDVLAVVFYRSIGFSAIGVEFMDILKLPVSEEQKFMIAMAIFACTADNVILTRALKTAAPYFDYGFASLSAKEKQTAFNKLSFYQVYFNLNILSGLTTSSGVALFTYLCANYMSENNDMALALSLSFGSLKLFNSVMAQRDLASGQNAIKQSQASTLGSDLMEDCIEVTMLDEAAEVPKEIDAETIFAQIKGDKITLWWKGGSDANTASLKISDLEGKKLPFAGKSSKDSDLINSIKQKCFSRLGVAKKIFSVLAQSFKEDIWLWWFTVVSCTLGRGARLSSFEYFNEVIAELFPAINLSTEMLIAVLLLVVMANARNEFKMFSDGMMSTLPQKIAEAYVEHTNKYSDVIATKFDEESLTPLLTPSSSERVDNVETKNKTNTNLICSWFSCQKKSVPSFHSASVLLPFSCNEKFLSVRPSFSFEFVGSLFPLDPKLYRTGLIDTTPEKLSKSVIQRQKDLSMR